MFLSRLQHAFSDPFTLAWNVGTMVTLGLPLMAYTVARLTNEQYQQDQQNQQDQQEQYYQNYYDQYGNYIGPTHWWQFWKRSNNNNYNYDQQQQQDEGGGGGEQAWNRSPWWYIWGDEREGEGGPDEQEGQGVMVFVYVWTLLLIIGLVYLGNTTDMNTAKLNGLRWALIGFLNYCLVTMILLASLEGGIETDGRELEEDGWYGQTAVLIFLTCLFGLIQSIVFISWTGKRIRNKENVKTEIDGYVDVGADGYKNPYGV